MIIYYGSSEEKNNRTLKKIKVNKKYRAPWGKGTIMVAYGLKMNSPIVKEGWTFVSDNLGLTDWMHPYE